MIKTIETGSVALSEARAAAYGLVAHGFQYPDADWYAVLGEAQRWREWPEVLERARPGFRLLVAEISSTFAAHAAHGSRGASAGALSRFQAAFDALFGHAVTGSCAAYETEYGDSEISQRSALLADLAGFYQAFGLESAHCSSDRPDFVAVECEFMSVLCAKEAHGWRSGSDEWIECCVDAQRAFLKDHLARWLPALAERVKSAETDPFYRALGRLGHEIVALDCEQFGLPLGPRWLALRSADQEAETTISCLDATDCGPGSERLTPLNIDVGGE